MKKVRLFVLSSSLVLAAWLGASFMTEVKNSPEPEQTVETSRNGQQASGDQPAEESSGATLPVAHFK